VSPTRRRRSRGQALTELALAFPVLILVVLGGMDLAQAYRFGNDAQGAARAGMLAATHDNSSDIGITIRQEPSNVINSTTSWGNEDPAGSRANCTGASTTCGDGNGCQPSSFTAGQTACFAVRSCSLTGSGSFQNLSASCDGTWGSRPAGGLNKGIQVVVVFAYKPFTPLISTFGTNGVFYIKATAEGLELY
jgi:Flp pilus assembly protein TadG